MLFDNSDGVRIIGAEISATLFASPEHDGRLFGMSPPFQLLDDMPVDLSWRSVKMRIERSQQGRGMCSTSGDPLGATYYLAKSKAHQVEHVLPIGLNTFLPVTKPQPLPPGGRWVMEDGRLNLG